MLITSRRLEEILARCDARKAPQFYGAPAGIITASAYATAAVTSTDDLVLLDNSPQEDTYENSRQSNARGHRRRCAWTRLAEVSTRVAELQCAIIDQVGTACAILGGAVAGGPVRDVIRARERPCFVSY